MKQFLLTVLCLLPSLAFAQGSSPVQNAIALDGQGRPLPGVTVAICTSQPNTTPGCGGSSLLQTSTTATLSVNCTLNPVTPANLNGAGCTNPGTADGFGNVLAFAPSGAYWCQFSGSHIVGVQISPCGFPNLGGISFYGNINNVLWVGTGTYGTLAAAIAALPSTGGIVVTPPHYRETLTAQLELGSSTKPVLIQCSTDTVLTAKFQNAGVGTNFNAHNASGFVGSNPGSDGGGRTGGCAIVVDPLNSVKAIVDTPEGLVGQGGQSSVILQNVFITANMSSTCSEIVNIEGVSGVTAIANLHIDTFNCIGLMLQSNTSNVLGPVTVINPELNGTGVSGARPFVAKVFTNSIVGISIVGGSITHPGQGLPVAEFNGNGTLGGFQGVAISDSTYIENLANGAGGGQQSMGIKLADVQNVHISALNAKMCGNLLSGSCSGVADTALINISQTGAGRTCNLTFVGLAINAANNVVPAINNTISTETIGGQHVPFYTYGGDASCSAGGGVTFSSTSFQMLDRAGNVNVNIPIGGSSVFRNWLDSTLAFSLDSGSGAGAVINFNFRDRGAIKWFLQKDASNNLFLQDLTNTATRIFFGQNPNPAGVGVLRLINNSEAVGWRNAANNGDDLIKFDASDRFIAGGSGVCPNSGTACIYSGTGPPGINCTVGSIFMRTDAANPQTATYNCQPANNWNAITVP